MKMFQGWNGWDLIGGGQSVTLGREEIMKLLTEKGTTGEERLINCVLNKLNSKSLWNIWVETSCWHPNKYVRRSGRDENVAWSTTVLQ
jgi:hypothetical protein